MGKKNNCKGVSSDKQVKSDTREDLDMAKK